MANLDLLTCIPDLTDEIVLPSNGRTVEVQGKHAKVHKYLWKFSTVCPGSVNN
jgi:hypothetical protein